MPRQTISVIGIPGLKSALARKTAELHEATKLATAAEVKLIEADARGHAPVDTGELSQGIQSEVDGTKGVIHTTAKHSAAQEFGTVKNPAHPFMHPAAEAARRRFPKTAAAIIRRAIGG